MARSLQVDWTENAEELKQKYRVEKHPQRRERLFTLWHLRLGKQIREMATLTGTDERVIQRWVAWYRAAGLPEVLRRGHGTWHRRRTCLSEHSATKSAGSTGEIGRFQDSMGCDGMGKSPLGHCLQL